MPNKVPIYRQEAKLKIERAVYSRAIALLALDPRNAEYPTTAQAALVSNLFRVMDFDKIFRDIKACIEKSSAQRADPSSDEFMRWWEREIGE